MVTVEAVVVRPPAINYGAGIVGTMPHVDPGDVREYPPTQRFGRFAIDDDQLAEAERLVHALQANRLDAGAWQEFAQFRKRMGSYEIEFVRTGEDARALEFRAKLSLPWDAPLAERACK